MNYFGGYKGTYFSGWWGDLGRGIAEFFRGALGQKINARLRPDPAFTRPFAPAVSSIASTNRTAAATARIAPKASPRPSDGVI